MSTGLGECFQRNGSIPADMKVFTLRRVLQGVHTGNELKNETKSESKVKSEFHIGTSSSKHFM